MKTTSPRMKKSSPEIKYSDNLLLSRDLNRGSDEAFDYLFRTRYRSLVNYAYSIVRDMSGAEDIVQDIFSTIWQKCSKIKQGNTVDSYLHTAVYNKCVDYISAQSRKDNALADILTTLRSGSDDPDYENGDYAWLRQAVAALPDQCRRILEMVVVDGMKYQEVADSMNLSHNTAKTQIKIAYRKIRETNNQSLLRVQ